MNQEQWDELKRLDALRNEDMQGVGLNRANEIMDAKLAFLKLLDAYFPQIVAEREAAQAKIDALMLEYCPDEMTPEQLENWGRNQRSVSPEQMAEIESALSK